MFRSRGLSLLRDKIGCPYAMRLECGMFLSYIFTKKSEQKFSLYALLISLLLFNTAGQVRADCSCSPNYPPYDPAADEWTADSCEPDANGRYYYKLNSVRCDSGVIKILNSYSYFTFSPAEVANFYPSGYTILRNESGTHIFVIIPHYPPLDTLLGGNVPSSSGMNTFPELDKYCTYFPLGDNDNDGYPDCLDCIPNDPTNEGSCISTPNNLGQCLD